MQAVVPNAIDHAETRQPTRLAIRAEVIAIIVLIAVSLLLRLISLGAVPVTETEIEPALAAWRDAMPGIPGETITTNSVMLYWSQRVAFVMFGGSEFAARIFTALAGAAVSVSPLLFRGLLGRSRAYLFAMLLTFSPVLLAASRLSNGVVWSMLFAVLGLWSLWGYWEDKPHRKVYGVLVVVSGAGLVLLSEPAGSVLALILAGAGVGAVFLSAMDAPNKLDIPGNDFLADVQAQFHDFPWRNGFIIAGLVLAAISTGFMMYPSGISIAAQALEDFAAGFVRSSPGSPLFYPLLVSLFYELWVWALALIAIIVVIRRAEISFVNRFLAAWVVLGGVASLVYQGAGAAHALWLVVPLAGLASQLVRDALVQDDVPTLWLDLLDDEALEANSARWGKYLLAAVTFALLVMAALHFQIASRAFLSVPDGSLIQLLNRLGQPGFNDVTRSLIWFVISMLFIVVGYFLAASVWGNIPAARGGLLGLFAFVLMTNLSTGWHLAVDRTDNPSELWHVNATLPDASLVRQTLKELAFRETEGTRLLPVVVVGDDNDLVAWLLRDFVHVRFANHIGEARTEQIVLMPDTVELPDLGGSYVGQRFDLSQRWQLGSLQGFDILPWWVLRETRSTNLAPRRVVLWVRQDIYNSQPFTPNSPVPGVG